jgi:hypothetical protein
MGRVGLRTGLDEVEIFYLTGTRPVKNVAWKRY